MTRTLVTRPLALVAAGALVLTACGGEDTLTKEEFIAQGDAICQTFEDDYEALPQPEEEPGAVGQLLQDAAPLTQRLVDDLAALAPPEDGLPVQAALLDSTNAVLELLQEVASAAETDRDAAADLFTDFEAGDGFEISRDYGFQVCGGIG